MGEIHKTKHGKFYVFRNRLKNEFPYSESRHDPLLWFVRDMQTTDMVVCGVKTKREALAQMKSYDKPA